MKKKIIIIGGSIAGLNTALILASAINKDLDFEITIIDEGKADILKAEVYNVPFFPKAIKGEEIISHIKNQITSFTKISYINAKATEISGNNGALVIKSTQGEFNAEYAVIATGASECDIKGLEEFIEPHDLMPKPGKIKLKHTGRNLIKDGVYVAGIASGVTSMVSCALGSAAETACAILSDIKGSVSVIHDFKDSRK
ncbi:FAD-dependent oxidoreductase [Helicobacter cappadocius]|uniref:FAD-dependent oxidoreductase n=1 Tax=Helicobacter cappadocius TaxID=3063998 RepID=A0AA90PLA6_9HELI|nr:MULTISPECIES: FAD-dependent oxidoreductase [unclassified Helicobacter]MDO7253341.1 FAD-dependent oxidoreductase [Helicobacter sp. faydin-H75]MDP2539229.1 FAD-dependent oxidoreductase [Helicobacter sp. faydin-H76]